MAPPVNTRVPPNKQLCVKHVTQNRGSTAPEFSYRISQAEFGGKLAAPRLRERLRPGWGGLGRFVPGALALLRPRGRKDGLRIEGHGPEILDVDRTLATIASNLLAGLGDFALIAGPGLELVKDEPIGARTLDLAAHVATVITLDFADNPHRTPPWHDTAASNEALVQCFDRNYETLSANRAE
jgi:hypothetical protein